MLRCLPCSLHHDSARWPAHKIQKSSRTPTRVSYLGFRSTTITLSPRKNILLMKRSLLTGFAFAFPFPVFGTSVHISLTFSKTMLQCLSKALTRPSNFLLLRQLIRTWVLLLTLCVNTYKGPVVNSSSSVFAFSPSLAAADARDVILPMTASDGLILIYWSRYRWLEAMKRN